MLMGITKILNFNETVKTFLSVLKILSSTYLNKTDSPDEKIITIYLFRKIIKRSIFFLIYI